ncbi:sigma 54-interacting transcriptional regulator [Treponema parvum]|uniref:sigma 54-interacting transcriptional regulator n=1 Tax=Treponema parvum TaxID=138851 RepID=UPI001AEC6EC7|nr:sigma 54-interacting transcriptional regulator [Treponema parvum]QTQ15519.1 sigma-54-dependent Fis family transcriptional regulator [Treponema parvum]
MLSAVLSSEIHVYTARPEIANFFRKPIYADTEVHFYSDLQFINVPLLSDISGSRGGRRRALFIDPKIADKAVLNKIQTSFYQEDRLKKNTHFIMPQDEVLSFLQSSENSDASVIPLPCDEDIFLRTGKKLPEYDPAESVELSDFENSILSEIIGGSPFLKKLKFQLALAARSDLPVIFLGEPGTGKSFAASFIHRLSKRRRSLFCVLDMGTLSENLADTELFGSRHGTFTGAVDSSGLLLLSDGGTLFLDEIANTPISVQAKLLRFLETGAFRPVGAVKENTVDSRLIFATNADLQSLIEQRLFREDLYDRINVFPIRLSPLRDRIEDIKPLAENFLSKNSCRISDAALSLLESYDWPGNVRQLMHCLSRAMLFCRDNRIDACDILFD